jgi:hypothetical protein
MGVVPQQSLSWSAGSAAAKHLYADLSQRYSGSLRLTSYRGLSIAVERHNHFVYTRVDFGFDR